MQPCIRVGAMKKGKAALTEDGVVGAHLPRGGMDGRLTLEHLRIPAASRGPREAEAPWGVVGSAEGSRYECIYFIDEETPPERDLLRLAAAPLPCRPGG